MNAPAVRMGIFQSRLQSRGLMAPVQWSEDKATAGAQLNGELIG